MATGTTTSPASVVIDANVVIAICAKEPDKVANAEAKIKEYAGKGCRFYAPGVIVSECLFVFCKKVKASVLTQAEHSNALQAFIKLMNIVNPPPLGDKALIKRADEIRGGLTCKRTTDAIYLALAEELGRADATEVVTFDDGLRTQAAANSLKPQVVVLPTA
jgi:predicted nucleic acid-binding protein